MGFWLLYLRFALGGSDAIPQEELIINRKNQVFDFHFLFINSSTAPALNFVCLAPAASSIPTISSLFSVVQRIVITNGDSLARSPYEFLLRRLTSAPLEIRY